MQPLHNIAVLLAIYQTAKTTEVRTQLSRYQIYREKFLLSPIYGWLPFSNLSIYCKPLGFLT